MEEAVAVAAVEEEDGSATHTAVVLGGSRLELVHELDSPRVGSVVDSSASADTVGIAEDGPLMIRAEPRSLSEP